MMPGRIADRSGPRSEGHDALEWAPESSVDGRGYTIGDHETELVRHLPDRWDVSQFEMLSPDEKNQEAGRSSDSVSSIPMPTRLSE